MTISPAYAPFTEIIICPIEPGERADLILLSQDVMEVSVEKILKTEVLATVMDGIIVYGKVWYPSPSPSNNITPAGDSD